MYQNKITPTRKKDNQSVHTNEQPQINFKLSCLECSLPLEIYQSNNQQTAVRELCDKCTNELNICHQCGNPLDDGAILFRGFYCCRKCLSGARQLIENIKAYRRAYSMKWRLI